MTETPTFAAPPVVDRATWQKARAELLAREKAHTRAGDAIAAARRRLPMTEVPDVPLVGADGPTTLLEVFEGRELLITYRHMWHDGKPFEGQCEGCTLAVWHMHDPVYLRARGISFAVLCEGPWEEVAPFREFMGYVVPWFSTHAIDDPLFSGSGAACFLRRGDRVFLTYATTARGDEPWIPTLNLLDLTVYGRQEVWEDSPEGWPQGPTYAFWRTDGRPTPQWTRPGVTPVGATATDHRH